MSTFATDEVDLQYLKQGSIGKVIAEGFAVVCREKPKFPVDFLAKWLLNYSRSVNNENNLKQKLKDKQNLLQEYKDELDNLEKQLQATEEAKQQDEQIDIKFREQIINEPYHDVLLVSEFPTFLEERKGLTGVYIGIKDYAFKEINEEEEDETAHLDLAHEKLINYIGYSISQENIMKGKTLSAKEEESITASAFKVPHPVEEGATAPPTYVYVPDLIKEPRITYFRLPKLGAFVAFPLKYNSYLKDENFDDGLLKRQEFQAAHEKWETEKREKEEQFQKEIEELEGDEEGRAAKQVELEEMLQEYPEEPQEQEFLNELKEYVVCADTMGQDRQIPAEDIAYLESYVKLFAKSWEDMELKLLSEDIDRQILYLKEVNKERIEQLNGEEEKAEEESKVQYEEIKESNEKLYKYRLDSVRLEKQKQLLLEEDIKNHLLNLVNFRILKFPSILQNVFYLLGYTMEEINVPGTHIFNWKYAKTLLNEDFLQRVVEYTYQGQKPNPVKVYALVNRISSKLEKIEMESVEQYNIGYARLFKWILDVCTLRKTDIEIRREAITERLNEIEKQKELLEEWEGLKESKLEEAKEGEEDPNNFNLEEWTKNFEEEHPQPIVPEELEQEVDEDCEFD